jgi:ParB family transcriptional regulator, chromosome partitioning protein
MKNLVSLKKIAEDKEQTEFGIKKITDYGLDPRDISIEPGFNARDMVNLSRRTRAHIDAIKAAIRAGEKMPPLEVRVAGDKIYVIDGHCRLIAILELIAEGEVIPFVDVREVKGSDVDRDFIVLNSSSQLHLSRLEQGRIYKRRVNCGWTVQMIAERARKSVTYVEQNLLLINADSDVHLLLEDEAVAVKVALDAIRKHGANAGAHLKGIVAGTKGKVTPSKTSAAFSPKLAEKAAESMAGLFRSLPPERLETIRAAAPDEVIHVRAADLQALLSVHDSHLEKSARKAKKNTVALAA